MSLIRSRDYSTVEVSELFGVGGSTVHRTIQRERDRGRSEGVVLSGV